MGKRAVVVLCHGSKEVPVTHFMERLLRRASSFLPADLCVGAAYLQFNDPDLETAVASLEEKGVEEVYVAPLFVLPGRHQVHDIPRLVSLVSKGHPSVRLTLCRGLGEQNWLCEAIARWISLELPDSAFGASGDDVRSLSGKEIMSRSMKMAEDLLGLGDGNDAERRILLRILHATGDPTMMSSVSMSPDAAEKGIQALLSGKPVITDVNMVKAGVNRRLADKLGCPVYCAAEESSDPDVRGTRVAHGMEKLSERMEGSIVVIGNAPTALRCMLDLILTKKIRPSLIIGTPVGFVHALEAKRGLMSSGVPYVTVQGTRGGSAVAVGAMNALLEMAAEEKAPPPFISGKRG